MQVAVPRRGRAAGRSVFPTYPRAQTLGCLCAAAMDISAGNRNQRSPERVASVPPDSPLSATEETQGLTARSRTSGKLGTVDGDRDKGGRATVCRDQAVLTSSVSVLLCRPLTVGSAR